MPVIERPRPLIVTMSKPFELVVDHGAPFPSRLASCWYGWVNRHISPAYFVSEERGCVRYSAMYLVANRRVLYPEMRQVIQREDVHRPWRFAKLDHLLADAASVNEVNVLYPIAALGQSARIFSDQYYACSYLGGDRPSVGVQQTSLCWFERTRFLVVRPAV